MNKCKLFGYARTSRVEQNFDRQLDQLLEYGVHKSDIYMEQVTGTKRHREQLDDLLENKISKGDTILVVDITRVSRSTKDLLDIVDKIKSKGANIKSLKDTWLDTTSSNPYNEFLLTVMSGLSQLERDLISERTKEGLASARARGRMGGRPKTKDKDIERALILYDAGDLKVNDICELVGISKPTLYKYINKRNEKKIDMEKIKKVNK